MISPRNALVDPGRLAAVRRLNPLDSRTDAGIDRLTRLAAQQLKAPISLFSLVLETEQELKSARGLSGEQAARSRWPVSDSFCRLVVETGKPVAISDARKDPALCELSAVKDNGFVAYAGVPVKCAQGHVVGAFCVIDMQPREWRAEEVRFLSELVELLGPLTNGTVSRAADAKLRHALDVVSRQQFALDQHAIVAVTDLQGTITYANDKFCQISGYSREELVGQNHRLIKSDVHPVEFFKGMWDTITQRRVWHGEICNKARNGQLYWVHTTIVPFIDENGNLEQYVAIRSDITALKRMTEELRFSQQRLTSIIEAMADGLVVRDSSGRVINANAAAQRILGINRDQLHGLTFAETPLRAVHEDERLFPPEEHPFMQTLRTGEAKRDVVMGIYRGDNSLVWISVNTQPIRDVEGTVIAVVSNFTDITRRLKADRALRDSEALLRTFVEHAPAAVAMFDRKMRYLVASRQWYTDYHLPQKDIVGMTHYEVFPEIPDRWKEDHKNCLAGQIIRSEADLFIRADGSKQWLSYEVRPWTHMDGSIGGVVMFTRDITMLKLAEAERAQLEQKLMETQKLESLGVLAGGIAHDFNNILTGIVGNNSLAQLDTPEDSPVRKHLQGIADASQRAADLIRQMLAYSGRGRFIIKKLDLSRIVEETTQLLTISISKKATLHYDLARDLPPVQVDSAQISQVIMNLVINASEAIGDQPGDIFVHTGLMHADRNYLMRSEIADPLAPGDYVFLEVRDTGCGIQPENLKRIFEPFFTTKFTGRGLGLAAVLGIVRGHQGTLCVSSELGKGTTFRMLLPCVLGSYDTPTRSPFAETTVGTGGAVLVVDDEETVREVMARILASLGYTVILAVDGQDGVEQFRMNHQFLKLVLLDLTMPKLDGSQAFAAIRGIDADVPVMLMSGYSEQEATALFSGQGLAGFIQKPFDVATLRRLLAGAIANNTKATRV
ncbi:MAG: PAS domain S-box protein [Nibricoccus sp.]